MPSFVLPKFDDLMQAVYAASKFGGEFPVGQMRVDVNVSGLEDIKKNLQFLNQQQVKWAGEEAKRLAEYLRDQSLEQCPMKTGDLRGTVFLHEDSDTAPIISYSVGYDSPYALYVHEIQFEHYTTAGTKWHYLSDPAEQLAGEFPDKMRQGLQRGLAAIMKQLPAVAAKPLGGPRLVKKAK